jgi:uncharacterized protein (TIGR03067 family)
MRIKVMVLLAVVFASAGVVAGGDAKADRKKIEGTWSVASAQKGGKDAPEGEIQQLRLVFAGDKLTLKFGEKSKEGTFKIDPGKKPKHIDVTMGDKTAAGLYRFNKGMLELCVVEPGGERPTEFKSPEGSMIMILILKREKE